MRNIFLGLVLCLFVGKSAAQQPDIIGIAKSCSTARLKKNLYTLAAPQMEGRMMGSRGDSLASNFIINAFQQAGLKQPYNGGKSYVQPVQATQLNIEAAMEFRGKRYSRLEGWTLYPPAAVTLTSMSVIVATDTTMEDVLQTTSGINLKGKALAISGGAFLTALYANKADSMETVLAARGVKAIIWSHPRVAAVLARQKEFDFIPQYKQPPEKPDNQQTAFPELALVPELMQELIAPDDLGLNETGQLYRKGGKDPVQLKTKISCWSRQIEKKVLAPNVIGIWPGTDPSLPVIVVSAHHDHDGKNGSVVYPGAVDNASGTVALIEMANMLKAAKKEGLRPKRSIVFASFTGEERGLLGSTWYADHPIHSMKQTHAVLNIDMMGRVDTFYSGKRPDSNYAYILVEDTLNRKLRDDLYAANRALADLTLNTYYEQPQFKRRRLTGSDQYPFYLKGVPFIRIDCGFCIDYHKPTDTPDKINYDLLTKQVQLAFLTLWNMAGD